MKLIYLTTLLFLISSCANISTEYKEPAEFRVIEDTLYYKGEITGLMVLKALEMARYSSQPIHKLHIDSPGGNARAGITFGNWIHENKIEVTIENLCFSSCANYIFTSASSVHVLKGAIVGWHGGAFQQHWKLDLSWYEYLIPNRKASKLALLNSKLKSWKDEETAFFHLIGVDQQITTYGQLDEYNCQKQTGAAGWNYNIRDLHKLGVMNVTLEDRELVLKNEQSNISACRISLSDS